MSTGRLPAAAGSPAHQVPSDEEFLSRFGDVIDDRIAETLDELLGRRDPPPRRRWLRLTGIICLVAAALVIGLLWR